MNTKEKIFIGLDIGTDSVGYAVTDGDYNVFKKQGKHLIGVRLFNEASVAKERRIFRANKVRKNREKNRICLLQELFNNEINKIDPLCRW